MTIPRRYRKQPVEIDAVRWDGTAAGATPIINWILANGSCASYYGPSEWDNGETTSQYIAVNTLEGRMLTGVGDYIIKGIKDEFYPCRADIFEATYARVDPKEDVVNHPKHYTSHPSGIEAIDITRHLSFDLGNAVKYVMRAPHKNGLEDYQKALWYLRDHLAHHEGRPEIDHETVSKLIEVAGAELAGGPHAYERSEFFINIAEGSIYTAMLMAEKLVAMHLVPS